MDDKLKAAVEAVAAMDAAEAAMQKAEAGNNSGVAFVSFNAARKTALEASIAYVRTLATQAAAPQADSEEANSVGYWHKRITPGEPSFVLLGRDPQAPALLLQWAADRERAEPSSNKPAKARAIAERMTAWKDAHPNVGMARGKVAAPQAEAGELYTLAARIADRLMPAFEHWMGGFEDSVQRQKVRQDAYTFTLNELEEKPILAQPAAQGGDGVTEAMAKRYLDAQRAYLFDLDQRQGRSIGAIHTDHVIAACMAGLTAALAPQRSERGE